VRHFPVREAAIGQGAIDARPGGQVGWAVVSVWAGPGQSQKVAGPVEEGRGTRRSAGPNWTKGRKYFG
jgi:hypothetical protein